jgi:endoglucanase
MFRLPHGRRWALAALVAALGSSGAYAQQCQVNYTQAWTGGNAHGANVEIRNLGAPINGWTLTFNFPGGQTLQNGWPVTVTQSGTTVTAASNAPWNASIPTNGTFTVGLNANGPFSPTPTSFTLNGVVCGGGPNPVNTAPTISITAPANNSTAPTTAFPFNATAADTNTGGAIQRVEFRVNGTLVATDTTAPYSTTVNPASLAFGANTLQATAFDNGVPAPVMSASASVTVNRPNTGGNTAPTVQITAPAANANVQQGTALAVSANASDPGGAVARVDFRLDGSTTVSATDATAPYTGSIPTTGLAAGAHTVCATAVDNGVPAPVLSSTQSCVTFNVVVGPTPSVQAVPTSVSVAGGASATATIRLSVAPANPVTVTITRAATGSTAIGPASQTVSVTSANNTAGVAATFTAAAGTTAASATFTASAPGHSPVTITVTRTTGPTGGNALFRVNANGRITKNGTLFPVRCGSWFGLEGRHEPSTDPVNPRGAAMEQYIGNTSWVNGGAGSGRTIAQTMQQIAGMGINVIRLPMVPQTLNANDPQGTGAVLKNHTSVRIANSRLAFETMIRQADLANIEVMLDVHSCSNYVGWRKGRFDARPPYADFDRDNYDFKREDAACTNTALPPGVTQIQPYNETMWRDNLRTLAGMSASLGVDNIIGIDIFNEPHDYTWAEWKRLTEVAFAEINAVNPNILLFVQGIGTNAGTQDGTPTTVSPQPHGVVETNPNWGENLFEQRTNPIVLPAPHVARERIVFSPHTYGPSVFVQKMFMDPTQTACTGLEGDAAGNADCRIVINPTLLRQGWEEHFGYLKQQGFAIVVGEFGGNLDWPAGQAAPRDRDRWSHITPGVDAQWQNAFVDYMISKGIEGCYWSINPESGDTAGWYGHAYHPITNPSGWGEWLPFDNRKTTLLQRLWQGVP